MKLMKPIATDNQVPTIERCQLDRTLEPFGLKYSGRTGDEVFMGDGTVVDLSKGGLGIRGNCPVRPDMDLTLFLYLPAGDDPLFILDAKVALVVGRHFGVEVKTLSLREGNRPQPFLRTQPNRQ